MIISVISSNISSSKTKYLPSTAPATAAFKTEHDPWQSPEQTDAVRLDMKFRFLTPLVKHSIQTFVSPANKSTKIKRKKEILVYYPVH